MMGIMLGYLQGMALLICFVMSCGYATSSALWEDGRALRSILGDFTEGSPVHQSLSPSWMNASAASWDYCGWKGVTCDPSSHRVLSLSLPPTPGASLSPLSPHLAALTHLKFLSLRSLNLSGPIPLPLFANLSGLRFLDLSDNSLTGPIPSSLFAFLPYLTALYINDNHLSGVVPPEIALCKNLAVICLQDNHLSGSIPVEIGQLSLLRIFIAGGNQFSGSLPPELGNCSSLEDFGVSVTGISGSIPSSFGRLLNLRNLRIFSTNISGEIPPELGNCSRLETLQMFQNSLTGPIPRELGKLRRVSFLNLWSNNLSGEIPAELGMLESLQVLELSKNELTGSIPSSIGHLSKLYWLHASINALSGRIPQEIGNCSSLTEIQLDNNKLTGNIPREFGKLSKLHAIYLWNNSLEGEVPPTLANCTVLKVMDFSTNLMTGSLHLDGIFALQFLYEILLIRNEFSGKIPPTIARCKSLQRLRLSHNRLTGSIPPELGELQNLMFFEISGNQISGMIPASIAKCQSLQLFDAHDNRLQGHIPSLLGLSNLQTLDLSFNLLTGPLPPTLGRLGKLDTLNLSFNTLSGEIPSELSGCKKLTNLDLSSNSLSGIIPSSLGKITTLSIGLNICCNSLSGPVPQAFVQMSTLEALDISHNKLSGNLDVFSEMGSLVSLNISYNLFAGHLPDTLPFTSMSSNNYAGNPGLCKPSCFADADGGSSKGSALRNKAINGPLFAAVGLMFAIGAFMLCSMIRSSVARTRVHKWQDIEWPWVLTPFQKLSFTVQDILDRMVDSNIVGKGCSGVVYKAVMPEGKVIAVKKVVMASSTTKDPSTTDADLQRDFFKTEMEILRVIRHKNIVRLLGFCTNQESSLLLYDYMPNGSLEDCIHKKRRMLDWERRYNIALGAAQGLAYLHHDCNPPILHRDVKASNILLGAHLEPYLADFGLAKIVMNSNSGATQTVLAGSYGYIAPEYAYSLSITEKSDVYSYGVVLLEMLTGKRPMEASLGEGRHLTEWVHQMRHVNDDVVDILDPCLRGMADPFVKEMLQTLTLALECVHPLPSERPSMRHVVTLLVHIRHPHVHTFAKLGTLASATCHPSSHLSTDTSFHTHTSSFSSPHNSHNLYDSKVNASPPSPKTCKP